jgi:hypothetical protein
LSLDACLQKLRYVKYGDEVRADDVNTKVECLRLLRDTSKAKAAELGCPSERVDPLVEELDSILATIRYVRSGDIIQPEDHNYVVEALKKARDILAEIEAFCSGLKVQLDRCLEELKRLVVVPAALLEPVTTAAKSPDAEARADLLTVKEVAARSADARSDISLSVSVSVSVS